MTPLDSFEERLKTLMPEGSMLRPFICDGSPLECKVFIVGSNAATTLSESFWHYWRPGHGFLKPEWLTDYIAERRARPPKPGKTRQPTRLSTTRNVLNWVTEAAGLPILETNVFSVPTSSLNELPPNSRESSIFEFLFREIEPKLVIAHGLTAQRELRKLYPHLQFLSVPHLSRGWSESAAQDLGHSIQRLMRS